MANDPKIAALYKTVRNIRKKLLLKINHIVSSKGKGSQLSKMTNHSCIQAKIDLLKNSINTNDTSFGPDFKIYESDCFLQRTPGKLPDQDRRGMSASTPAYQLPCDFLDDNHEGNMSVDYVNICEYPPPPLPPRRTLVQPPPVIRRNPTSLK